MPVLLVLCAAVDIVGIVACFDVGVVDKILFSYEKNDAAERARSKCKTAESCTKTPFLIKSCVQRVYPPHDGPR